MKTYRYVICFVCGRAVRGNAWLYVGFRGQAHEDFYCLCDENCLAAWRVVLPMIRERRLAIMNRLSTPSRWQCYICQAPSVVGDFNFRAVCKTSPPPSTDQGQLWAICRDCYDGPLAEARDMARSAVTG